MTATGPAATRTAALPDEVAAVHGARRTALATAAARRPRRCAS
ncbi:hypothetical protein [Streptomyces sp. NPDC046712]